MTDDQDLLALRRVTAHEALASLSALSELSMVKSQLSAWLTGDQAFRLRGLWICEAAFERGAWGSTEERSLFKPTLSALLGLSTAYQIKLLVIAKQERLELTRATLWSALMPSNHPSTESSSQPTVDATGRALTLGERRALARRPSAKSIEILLNDSDPIVLKHLLQNPRLTEELILRIVCRRPQSTKSLLMIFEHPIWGQRREIQRALALNPYSVLALRCALISTCSYEDRESILREPALPAPLKAAVNRQYESSSSDSSALQVIELFES